MPNIFINCGIVYYLVLFLVNRMPSTIIVGGTWGDEGKGKVVAYLAQKDNYDIITRAGVGPNAGHSIYVDGQKLGLRQLPCGYVNPSSRVLIGAGVLINPDVLFDEIKRTGLEEYRLGVDKRCAIIEKKHLEMDACGELKGKIGTTGTGCGPANADRALRKAKLAKDIPPLSRFLTDVPREVNEALDKKKKVCVEGTQGFLLSLYYGYEYPYVTSKDTGASSFASDVGLGPKRVDDVILVFKSYISRVGEGPFPTQMPKEEMDKLGLAEFGTVTGRQRKMGHLDWDLMKYSVMVNAPTQIALTCLDYRDRSIAGATDYNKLSKKAKEFIAEMEKNLGVPVTLVSTGKNTGDIIDLREEKL